MYAEVPNFEYAWTVAAVELSDVAANNAILLTIIVMRCTAWLMSKKI